MRKSMWIVAAALVCTSGVALAASPMGTMFNVKSIKGKSVGDLGEEFTSLFRTTGIVLNTSEGASYACYAGLFDAKGNVVSAGGKTSSAAGLKTACTPRFEIPDDWLKHEDPKFKVTFDHPIIAKSVALKGESLSVPRSKHKTFVASAMKADSTTRAKLEGKPGYATVVVTKLATGKMVQTTTVFPFGRLEPILSR